MIGQNIQEFLHDIPADWSATLAFGKGKEAKKGEWKNQTVTLETITQGLTHHRPGSKDGTSFLQGQCADGTRQARAMEKLYIIGIDVDNGTPSEEIDHIIRDRGLFCIRYTTHSHNRSFTEVRKDDFVKFERQFPGSTIVEYLINKKRYLPEIAETASIADEKITSNGMMYKVQHTPMDKNRLVFILSTPWDQRNFATTDEALKAWKNAYTAFSSWLNIPIDESCVDCSRLFYFPRYEAGSPYEAIVHQGKSIDIFALQVNQPRSNMTTANPFLDAATRMGASDDNATRRMLKKWAATGHADRFLIYDALLDNAEHILRPERDVEDKHHIECPFEDEHSSWGGSATFVVNAGESSTGKCIIKCMHGSCAERDKLDYLEAMLQKGWLTEDILYDSRYLIEMAEEAETEPELDTEPSNGDAAKPAKSAGAYSLELASKAIASLATQELSSIEVEVQLKRIQARLNDDAGLKIALTTLKSDYAKAAKSAQREEQSTAKTVDLAKKERTTGKVTIYVDTDFSQASDEALDALYESNKENPTLFSYANGIYRVELDKNTDTVVTRQVDSRRLRHAVKNVARFVKAQEEVFREIAPPLDVIDDILANPDLPFPPLNGINSVPVFGADGKICTKPGYDYGSRFYFAPREGFRVPNVSKVPTKEEMDKALDLLLNNVLEGFPFDGPMDGAAERAHALCMILQPFARQLINGSTPIYLIAKPSPGTGASKLVDIYSLITANVEASAQTETKHEDDLRKRITSVLLEGAPTFYLDNVNWKVDSSSLASAVTSAIWKDRLLGASQTVNIPVYLTWIIAGNNPKMSPEIARRCVRTRLDAKMAQPEARPPESFKHEDLEAWVKENHGQLVWACLTIIQNWIAQGKPRPPKLQPKGSFENWSRVMGGILHCAGIDGFLMNEKDMREGADDETSALTQFITRWWETFESNPVHTSNSSGGTGNLLDLVEDEDINIPITGNTPKAQKTSFGMYVSKLEKRVFNIATSSGEIKVRLEKAGAANNATKWKLTVV